MRVKEALLAGPLGFGTAALGSMCREISEDEALATIDAASDAGTRFFRYRSVLRSRGSRGSALAKPSPRRTQGDYVLNSKVGRLILDEIEDPGGRDHGEKGEIFEHGRPNRPQ
jgi:D-threo-aldose 1-dehydrogenase